MMDGKLRIVIGAAILVMTFYVNNAHPAEKPNYYPTLADAVILQKVLKDNSGFTCISPAQTDSGRTTYFCLGTAKTREEIVVTYKNNLREPIFIIYQNKFGIRKTIIWDIKVSLEPK